MSFNNVVIDKPVKIIKINKINFNCEYCYEVSLCTICEKGIVNDSKNDTIVKGICSHIYHSNCIKNKCNVCPLCLGKTFVIESTLDNNILYKKI